VQKKGFNKTGKSAIVRILDKHVYAGLVKVKSYMTSRKSWLRAYMSLSFLRLTFGKLNHYYMLLTEKKKRS
jgi:hypothetical protein